MFYKRNLTFNKYDWGDLTSFKSGYNQVKIGFTYCVRSLNCHRNYLDCRGCWWYKQEVKKGHWGRRGAISDWYVVRSCCGANGSQWREAVVIAWKMFVESARVPWIGRAAGECRQSRGHWCMLRQWLRGQKSPVSRGKSYSSKLLYRLVSWSSQAGERSRGDGDSFPCYSNKVQTKALG